VEKIKAVQIEDMITTRYRSDDPDIKRVGVARGPDGWRCYRVWLQMDVPPLPEAEIEAILADTDKILAELLQKYEIVEKPLRAVE
jgi:hypothetical protein